MNEKYWFTKTHEWVKWVDDNTALIGISQHAVDEMGDLVFINLPSLDPPILEGHVLANIESVKAVSDIYSPVSGVILEVNEELVDAPEKLNESPKEAWIAKIGEIKEIPLLMSEGEYLEYLKDQ